MLRETLVGSVFKAIVSEIERQPEPAALAQPLERSRRRLLRHAIPRGRLDCVRQATRFQVDSHEPLDIAIGDCPQPEFAQASKETPR